MIGVLTRRRTRPQPGSEDAFRVIDLTQQSIAGADVKASVLATAATVLAGVLVTRVDVAVLVHPGDLQTRVAAGAGLAALVALVATVAALGAVLVPRVKLDQQWSRFAWPGLVAKEPEWLAGLGAADERVEAWREAVTLARIAEAKHRYLKRAVYLLGVGLLLAGAWGLLGGGAAVG